MRSRLASLCYQAFHSSSCLPAAQGAVSSFGATAAASTHSTTTTRFWAQQLRSFAAGPAARTAKRVQAGAQQAAEAPALSPFERWWNGFKSAPRMARVLGLAGAVPFIALAPPVCKHLTGVLPADVVDNCALLQVGYGATIVSFLGAVHWGVAMSSSLTGAVATRIANESFIYSVLPCLAAWPVTVMEPGAGALTLSLLLPACYLADYTRRNLGLPQWYLPLRAPLTLLATFGMLLTATKHLHQELDRAKEVVAREGAA